MSSIKCHSSYKGTLKNTASDRCTNCHTQILRSQTYNDCNTVLQRNFQCCGVRGIHEGETLLPLNHHGFANHQLIG